MTKLQQKAIDHYDRMIAWAKTQPKKSRTNFSLMLRSIKEYWYGDDCPYCKKHDTICQNCELHFNHGCCGTLWLNMSLSKTWGTWIKNAEAVKQFIIEHGV